MSKYLTLAVITLLTLSTSCKKEKISPKVIEGLWEVTSVQIDKDGTLEEISLSDNPEYNLNYNFEWSVTQHLGTYSTVTICDHADNKKLSIYKISDDQKTLEIKSNALTLDAQYFKVKKWIKNTLELSKYDNVKKQTVLLTFQKNNN